MDDFLPDAWPTRAARPRAGTLATEGLWLGSVWGLPSGAPARPSARTLVTDDTWLDWFFLNECAAPLKFMSSPGGTSSISVSERDNRCCTVFGECREASRTLDLARASLAPCLQVLKSAWVGLGNQMVTLASAGYLARLLGRELVLESARACTHYVR